MLRKFITLGPRGCQVLGTNLRSCQAVTQTSPYNDSPSRKGSRKANEFLVGLFSDAAARADGTNKELQHAEHLIFTLMNNVKLSPENRISKILEFCNTNGDEAFRSNLKEKVYLWCSGVLAISSVLIGQKWFLKEQDITRSPQWLDPHSIQHTLKEYFWGIPRDRLLLSVKATDTQVQEEKPKKKVTIEDAAQEFKNKTDECTASILNKLGLQLMATDQKSQAAELFNRAAQGGHISAIYNMGLCYEHGRGVSQDHSKAVQYYKIAADKGHARAQFNLASFYAEGIGGLHKSYTKANELLEKAAENGIAKAQVYMGYHYAKQNKQTQSAKYFALAADKKEPVGMYHFAICLENGWGVRKDVNKAGGLYQEAAERGHTSAMFNTAVFYEKGLGGFTKSRSKALHWYEKAADQGDKEALKRLQDLLQRPQESQKLMHPILRDILMWSLFNAKPEEQKQFHKSKSAPNLRENSHNLPLQDRGSPKIDFRQQEISEDVSSSMSCGLQMSECTSSCSDLSIGLV